MQERRSSCNSSNSAPLARDQPGEKATFQNRLLLFMLAGVFKSVHEGGVL